MMSSADIICFFKRRCFLVAILSISDAESDLILKLLEAFPEDDDTLIHFEAFLPTISYPICYHPSPTDIYALY